MSATSAAPIASDKQRPFSHVPVYILLRDLCAVALSVKLLGLPCDAYHVAKQWNTCRFDLPLKTGLHPSIDISDRFVELVFGNLNPQIFAQCFNSLDTSMELLDDLALGGTKDIDVGRWDMCLCSSPEDLFFSCGAAVNDEKSTVQAALSWLQDSLSQVVQLGGVVLSPYREVCSSVEDTFGISVNWCLGVSPKAWRVRRAIDDLFANWGTKESSDKIVRHMQEDSHFGVTFMQSSKGNIELLPVLGLEYDLKIGTNKSWLLGGSVLRYTPLDPRKKQRCFITNLHYKNNTTLKYCSSFIEMTDETLDTVGYYLYQGGRDHMATSMRCRQNLSALADSIAYLTWL